MMFVLTNEAKDKRPNKVNKIKQQNMKAIKSFIAVAIVAMSFITSCDKNVANLQDQVDSLTTILDMNENLLNTTNEFISIMNTSMDSVILADGNFMVGASKEEGVLGNRKKMEANLETYNQMLQNQRRRIEKLEEELQIVIDESMKKDDQLDEAAKQNKATIERMTKMIANMKAQLDAKDEEIQRLKTEIANNKIDINNLKKRNESLARDVNTLNEVNERQKVEINETKEQLSTGYYIVASKQELKEKKILDGGNLFKKSKLNMSNASLSNFRKINIYNTTSIRIPDSSAKLRTQAPEGSYSIQQNGDGTCTLVISNPEKFWSLVDAHVIQY